MTTNPSVLALDRDGHVATVWLDRPEKRNAMGRSFWTELPAIMDELSDEPEVRAVVIAPRGEHFSAGIDLAMLAASPIIAADAPSPESPSPESPSPKSPSPESPSPESPSPESPSPAARAGAAYREIQRLQRAFDAVADCPKPVIAAIWGWCIGAGVDLASACDIRLASADARLSLREVKMAIVADLGSLQRLPRIVPKGHLAELAFTGKDITASRAKEIGLVNDVFPDAAATYAAALALATEIAASSPLAVQGTKAVLAAGEGQTVAEGLRYVAVWNAAFLRSDDLREAVTASIEKRPAEPTGS